MIDLTFLLVSPANSIQEAMTYIDRNTKGIVLVIDDGQPLLGAITDGDIRRAILAGISLDTPVSELLARKNNSDYSTPITAHIGTNRAELLNLMREHAVRQIPLLDDNGRVVDLVILDQLLPDQNTPSQAVIITGSACSRLHPLADDLPKPMLPVGNRPLLDWTIGQLRQSGIKQIYLTTHYQSPIIENHFQNGDGFGVEIRYLNESQPPGLSGAWSTLQRQGQPILIMNGDVLSRVNFRAMLDFHNEQRADLTIAVRQHEFQIPYGVVEMDGGDVIGISEQPMVRRFVNAGIYLLNPDLLDCIPQNHSSDISELIQRVLADHRRVSSFPIHEYWLDIQDYKDYRQLLTDAQNGMLGDLGSELVRLEPGTPAPQGMIPLCVPEIRGNEWAYIKECLDTNWVSSVGPFVDRFEEAVAGYVGAKYGIAASSGTAALHIALLVAGVQPEDEVLVSTLTFIAPVNAIRYVGAYPIFVDAEPDYWQMDPQKVRDWIARECAWRNGALYNRTTGRRITAILPVHILGHPCAMLPIMEIARKYDLSVIEDATESLGAKYQGQMVGHIGDIACFSFNGNKLITTGGGGIIVTDREDWARKAKYLTTQAKDDPVEFVHGEIGYNYRLTNIQAAMGCAQMEQLADFLITKKNIATRYAEGLREISGITLMPEASYALNAFWLYTVLVNETHYGRDSRALMRRLAQEKIQTRPLWQPNHLSPAHSSAQRTDCAVAERLNRTALSLPCSVGFALEQQKQVINLIHQLRADSLKN